MPSLEFRDLATNIEESDLPTRVELLYWDGTRRVELVVEGVDLQYGHRGAVILANKARFACEHPKINKYEHCGILQCDNYAGRYLTEAEYCEITKLLYDGMRIDAIKKYREFTNLGLKEAKEDIDRLSVFLRR